MRFKRTDSAYQSHIVHIFQIRGAIIGRPKRPLPISIILLKTPKFPERNVGIVKEVEIAKSVVKHLEKNSTKEMGLMIQGMKLNKAM